MDGLFATLASMLDVPTFEAGAPEPRAQAHAPAATAPQGAPTATQPDGTLPGQVGGQRAMWHARTPDHSMQLLLERRAASQDRLHLGLPAAKSMGGLDAGFTTQLVV